MFQLDMQSLIPDVNNAVCLYTTKASNGDNFMAYIVTDINTSKLVITAASAGFGSIQKTYILPIAHNMPFHLVIESCNGDIVAWCNGNALTLETAGGGGNMNDFILGSSSLAKFLVGQAGNGLKQFSGGCAYLVLTPIALHNPANSNIPVPSIVL